MEPANGETICIVWFSKVNQDKFLITYPRAIGVEIMNFANETLYHFAKLFAYLCGSINFIIIANMHITAFTTVYIICKVVLAVISRSRNYVIIYEGSKRRVYSFDSTICNCQKLVCKFLSLPHNVRKWTMSLSPVILRVFLRHLTTLKFHSLERKHILAVYRKCHSAKVAHRK